MLKKAYELDLPAGTNTALSNRPVRLFSAHPSALAHPLTHCCSPSTDCSDWEDLEGSEELDQYGNGAQVLR